MAQIRMTPLHTSSPRVFFYVQHLLGIGHLARASRIASAMAKDGCEVTVVTGGVPVNGFPGPDVTSVTLPPVVASSAGFSGLADQLGNAVGEDFLAARRDQLLDAFRTASPDIVIIEAFPFGRRQMRFELLPLLDAVARANPKPKLYTSVRDILQQQKKPGRDEETVALLRDHFDGVLVHGDPNFVRLEETFPLTSAISDKITYTGLVAPPLPPEPPEIFDIVVSAGGGAVGHDLIRASLEAASRVAVDRRWLLVTGPNLPEQDFAALTGDAPGNVDLVRFRKDFPSLLRGAELSISQAGYNTVGDLLVTGCRSILVPFTAGGETEQSVRAERLEKLGLALALPEAGLTTDQLADAVETALSRPKPSNPDIDLAGAERTSAVIRQR
ncbi:MULTISPECIES: glycosyltransferase [unclassified Rhizobium]|uniref:glycosyltransferase family protein n=1 Tax=unclassified Rhizobium TaxID=2613769 RepID=UPI001FDF5D4C|nr:MULTISPECIES: glycosyltransferase [Rhizobium]MDK4740148.1 glycosyltransferase [Rhizobium sp. CNPSo 3464]UWU25032.1 glycosyl transferase [Rhizobium tropici]